MKKLFIKVDENKNPIGHPQYEENLIMGFGETIFETGEYIEYRPPQLDPVTGATASIEYDDGDPVYILHEDGYFIREHRVRNWPQTEIVDTFVRLRRDKELAFTDWIMLPNSPFSDEEKAKWAKWRQLLRDLTKKYANVKSYDEIKWPLPPNPAIIKYPVNDSLTEEVEY